MLTLTATDLPRVMQCNGSLKMPAVESTEKSKTRDEGNAADWLIQQVYTGKSTALALIDKKAPNGVVITSDMADDVSDYLDAIGRGGQVEIESSIGDDCAWQVNSRADHRKLVPDTLMIDDFKYGYRIVEPELNWTLLAHAFGYVQNTRAPYPKFYTFTIHQPRPYHPKGHVRSWTISYDMLVQYYALLQTVLSKPSDTLTTGTNCTNCPAMASCPAALKAGCNAIDVSETLYVSSLGNDELSVLIDTMKHAGAMLEQLEKAYTELAKHRIKQGQRVKNYVLQNELTNTAWTPEATPELLQAMTGIDLTTKKLISPSQAKKAGVSEDFVKLFTRRDIKGTKLSRIDENTQAEKLFNQPKGL
jgi:hypothetical protein